MNHVHPLMTDRYVNDHLDDVRRSANQYAGAGPRVHDRHDVDNDINSAASGGAHLET